MKNFVLKEFSLLIPCCLFLLLFPCMVYSQMPAGNLDQVRNGSATSPTSPGNWVNGNAGASNAHYLEGYSIPYRIVIDNLTPGVSYSVEIEWDIKHSGKHAIDYITRYNYINDPLHSAAFSHPPEALDPRIGIAELVAAPGVEVALPAPCNFPFPAPFPPANILPAADRVMTIYNGTIPVGGMVNTLPCGNLNIAQSSDGLTITFTAGAIVNGSGKATVILAWGGHIGRSLDWGPGNAASGISGSPYHTRLIELCEPGPDGIINTADDDCGGGNQDRSLSAVAVYVPCGTCEVTGPGPVCPGSTNSYTSTITGFCGNPTTLWTITGNGSISGSATGSSVSVIAGNTCGASYTITSTTTCTDCSGSPLVCSQTVNVVDATPPVITFCPPGSALGCNPTGVPAAGTATATDNCNTPTITSALGAITSTGCLRSQTRTYTATDLCGNTAV